MKNTLFWDFTLFRLVDFFLSVLEEPTALKTEASVFSEMLINFYQNVDSHIPWDSNRHSAVGTQYSAWINCVLKRNSEMIVRT
jgi:hypothetical protein